MSSPKLTIPPPPLSPPEEDQVVTPKKKKFNLPPPPADMVEDAKEFGKRKRLDEMATGRSQSLLSRIVGEDLVDSNHSVGTDPATWTFLPSSDDEDGNATESIRKSDALAAQDRYTDLLMLLMEPSFELLEAICTVAPTNQSQKIIKPMVSVMISTRVINHYIAFRIKKVVDETVDKATLFRSKTFTTVLLSVFAQEVGKSYLKQVVRPLIASICSKTHSFEVDPDKAGEDEDTLQNTKNLIYCLEECFQFINNTIDRCPRSLWIGCKLLYQLVAEKFPTTSLSAVGGLFFLRFLCPALVNPSGVGLTVDGIGPRERRHLILVSKTLQSLSNGVEFGGKETYMMGLNKFIREYRPKINSLLEKLAAGPPVDHGDMPSQGIEESDCHSIHSWLIQYKEQIIEVVTKSTVTSPASTATLVGFNSVISNLGEPRVRSGTATATPEDIEAASQRKRTNTQTSSWKTSELPPELAAALLEVEMGTASSDEEAPSPRSRVLYSIGSAEEEKSTKKKKSRRSSLFFKLKKSSSSSSTTDEN